MKKDVIYSMRMNRQVRDALKKVAHKKHRTVASLLDKIISDYLEKEGYIDLHGIREERRRHARKKITLPGNVSSISGMALLKTINRQGRQESF